MSSNAQWYMVVGGQQVGPVTEEDIVNSIRSGTVDGNTLVFLGGMDNWTPLKDVAHFKAHLRPEPSPPPVVATSAPAPAFAASLKPIDYKIVGEDLQFIEVELDPGESVVAEAGALMYMTQGVEMETIFGDGSPSSQGGVMNALLAAGRRVFTGESLFMTAFASRGTGPERVAFAAPFPGRIIPLDLAALGGEIICEKSSFLCAARGTSIGIAFQKRFGVGLFGGEGFIMQRLQGQGLCFAHAGGMITTLDLGPGDTLRVDTGCIVALLPSVSYDIQFVGNVKTALFGGEGLFFATLRGPGRVWLQSLPFSRLAGRIYAAAPQTGGSRKEEGGVLDALGGIGRMIDGG
jgi:uncharacterized protein (TIGR00266 family)